MIIDAHVHVWKPVPDYSGPVATTVAPQSAVPVELLDEYLDEHGVSRAVLVQPVFPGEDNSYVADCAAARPDRYAAVCVVDPRQPDAAERLRYWVHERGCRGLRLRPRVPAEEAAFGDPATYPLWEEAARLGVIISVLAAPEHLPRVKALAERFPAVRVVVDHLAHPGIPADARSPGIRALLELSGSGNVFLKFSGFCYSSRAPFPYADMHSLFQLLLERFGAGRLIWGSDFPHALLKTTYSRLLRMPELVWPTLTSADRNRILGDNALQLYWGCA